MSKLKHVYAVVEYTDNWDFVVKGFCPTKKEAEEFVKACDVCEMSFPSGYENDRMWVVRMPNLSERTYEIKEIKDE